MIDAASSKVLIRHMHDLDRARRELQALSNEILTASKRAIFAFHRENEKQAKEELANANAILLRAKKIVKKELRLAQEGSWRAAQEELAEASLLADYVMHGSIKRGDMDPEIFLGALSDLTGELTRRAVRFAGTGDASQVHSVRKDVERAVELLLAMDLTGSLRTKTDQAKQNLRKLEEIEYDLSIRGRG